MVNAYAKTHGLSLVELMISLLLASIITSAAIGMLITDSQTSRFQINNASSHTSGRFAFDFLLADLRKAGYSDKTKVSIPVDGVDDLNDTLRIYYDATLVGNRDCVGNPIIAADPTLNEVVNEYKVVAVDNQQILTCNDQPLMAGVDGFQVMFGIDLNDNGTPDVYVKPGAQQAQDAVVTVQVAMLVATQEQGGEIVAQNYQLLDASAGPFNDGKGRTLFTTTERIRNINMDAVL